MCHEVLRLGEADSDDKYIAIAHGNVGKLQRIRGEQGQAGRHDAQINLSGVAPGPKFVPASIVNAFVLIDEVFRCPVGIVLGLK